MMQDTANPLTTSMRAQLHRFRDACSLLPLFRVGRPWQVQLLKPLAEQPVALAADQLQLAASYYPAEDARRPGVVLAHGASPRGRRQALTLVLAALFQKRGYHVLTYDARCYGESDHPADPSDAAGFDFSHDVRAALTWLGDRPEVDGQRLYVIGHSLGAGTALAADARDPRIARLVLFGPPRRLAERFLHEDAPDRVRILARMQRDMNVPYALDADVMRDVLRQRDIEQHVPRFQRHDHTPLLLIDAERESAADRAFLRAVWQRMSDRVRYWTAPGTDHYLNTGRLLRRVVYHPACVEPFVAVVDGFLRGDTMS